MDRIKDIEARLADAFYTIAPPVVENDIRYLLDEVKKLEAVREAAKDFMVDLMSGRAKADKLQIALAACEETDDSSI